ncbi:hypothetical protein AHAS_Ahas09G0184600 [Arachis hypogaea]
METKANFKNQEASIRNLELQLGQIAKQLVEKPSNSFPSDTIPNPRMECKFINLRSGKVVGKESIKRKGKEEPSKEEKNQEEKIHTPPPQAPRKCTREKMYAPRTFFPQRLHKETQQQQYSNFLKIFKKLQINIPFIEVLEKMPLYAKFMKEFLTKKRTLKEAETVILTKECNVIIQRKLS